jgi:tetratricopeptide (TPR) repeat protein
MRFERIIIATLFIAGCSKPAPAPPTASSTPRAATENQDKPVASQPEGVAVTPAVSTATAPEKVSKVSDKSGASGSPSDSPAAEKKQPVPTAGELIAQAREAAGAGVPNPLQPPDLEKAIELLEKALEQEPKNRAALGFITECTQIYGMQLAQQGIEEKGYKQFLKSGEYLRRWRETGTPLSAQEKQLAGVVYYNEACAFALTKEPDKAIASLGDALDAGFSDLNQLDKDADLNSLRDRDDYKKLREQAVERAQGAKEKDKQ